MNDKTLRSSVNVTLIELTFVHSLSSPVSAPANMEAKLSKIRHLVITIEGTEKHQTLVGEVAVCRVS